MWLGRSNWKFPEVVAAPVVAVKIATTAAQSKAVRWVVIGVLAFIIAIVMAPVALVAGVAGIPAAQANEEGPPPLDPGKISKEGWTQPARGPMTDRYGWRAETGSFHAATDLTADGCGGPIWAVHDGTVTSFRVDFQGNTIVTVDHGGVQSEYWHMPPSDILIREGDRVKAGQQIGRTGDIGFSFGCHLHFKILIGGEAVDPETFMAERGARLG